MFATVLQISQYILKARILGFSLSQAKIIWHFNFKIWAKSDSSLKTFAQRNLNIFYLPIVYKIA